MTQSSQPLISTLEGIRGKIDITLCYCREALELSVGCKKIKLVCLLW